MKNELKLTARVVYASILAATLLIVPKVKAESIHASRQRLGKNNIRPKV